MNDLTELETTTAPVVLPMSAQLARAEIDQQIATAQAYPRSITKVSRNILDLVTISPEAAEECSYALPRGGKPILGPSIRLAEIVGGQWGNCRIGARVVHVDRIEKYVEAEGVFHDLETNTATTARVRRRIVDSKGRLYNDDMIIVTGNAACSIAKRNAVLAGVPKAVWSKAYEAAERIVKGEIKTLPESRAEAMKQCAAFGVTPEMVFAALEIGGMDDLGRDELVTLGGVLRAIKGGEMQVEDYFKPVKPGAGPGTGAEGNAKASTADKLRQMARGDGGKAPGTDDAPGAAQSGTQVSAQELADAREAGATARRNGKPKAACPAGFRADDALFAAWTEGWAEADAALAEGGDDAE